MNFFNWLFRKEQPQKLAVCALIESEDGLVLGVSRKDDPTKFGLPGGKVEKGETSMEAMFRELREETGISMVSSAKHVFAFRCGEFLVDTWRVVPDFNYCEIRQPSEGLVKWCTWQELFDGPFGGYNFNLKTYLDSMEKKKC